MRTTRLRPRCPRLATGRPSCSRGRPPIATALLRDLDRLAERLSAGARPPLRELAHTLAGRFGTPVTGSTLAIVTTSHDDLIAKLGVARDAIRGGSPSVADPRGVYFAERPEFSGQKVAFIFPGQGSQTVGMLRDLAIHFEDVRHAYEEFDAAILASGREPIGPRVFPPPVFDEAARAAARRRLASDRGRAAGDRCGKRRSAATAREGGRGTGHDRRS